MIHELKILPEYFKAVSSFEKRFEVRKNDRNFKVGDRLWLKEWNQETKEYTGRTCLRIVTYILEGGQYGIEKDYVIMSLI